MTALQGRIKRCLDVAGSVALIIILLPVAILVAAAIAVVSPGPVLYVQEREGRGARPFRIFKFRTMRQDAASLLASHLASDPAARREYEEYARLRNDPRLLPFVGPLLRATSLDELP